VTVDGPKGTLQEDRGLTVDPLEGLIVDLLGGLTVDPLRGLIVDPVGGPLQVICNELFNFFVVFIDVCNLKTFLLVVFLGVKEVWENVPEHLLVSRELDINGWEIPPEDVSHVSEPEPQPEPSNQAPETETVGVETNLYSGHVNAKFLDKIQKLNSAWNEVGPIHAPVMPKKTTPMGSVAVTSQSSLGAINTVSKNVGLVQAPAAVSSMKIVPMGSVAVAPQPSSGGVNAVSKNVSFVPAPAPVAGTPKRVIILKMPQSNVASFLKEQHTNCKIIRRPSLAAAGIGGMHISLPLNDISNTVQK